MSDRHEVSHMIVRVARAHQLAATCLLRPLGLYLGQELLLMRLWERDDQSQADLAKALSLDPSTVTRTVRSLEQQGLLTRRPSERDRRALVVSLTDEGRALRDQVEHAWSELERAALAGMPDRQRAETLRVLRRLEGNLTAALPEIRAACPPGVPGDPGDPGDPHHP
ncbi:MarR family winged helix-turn-helix transcriptional regulator [Bailinhaonella thermotolerans]|uniref:MarR family transcriptional regulator n=1 Tax=Bailinhaonella thermotolerans TaxID=1070861 RepID=A0A3A4B502_9ACTN|nr:MarR family transcriptional regulator [Bailinhaonella thermotolerans]RJL33417.1 MarR family transcriptional regulator [Bailinhaonella thermotolerans]